MEDFVAGFNETADRHSSAADWIEQQRDASTAAEQACAASDYLAILADLADRRHAGEYRPASSAA